jgi:transposase
MWPNINDINVYIRPGSTDMRKQIDGLAQMVQTAMGKQPFTGDLFLFCGRSKTMLKALYWDRNGFCLLTKRLEQGRYPWPGESPDHQDVASLSHEELSMILDGIDFRKRFKTLNYTKIA